MKRIFALLLVFVSTALSTMAQTDMGDAISFMVNDVSELTSILVEVVPIIAPVGVLLIAVSLAWRMIVKFANPDENPNDLLEHWENEDGSSANYWEHERENYDERNEWERGDSSEDW